MSIILIYIVPIYAELYYSMELKKRKFRDKYASKTPENKNDCITA
ncbi:hypothetical protein FACS1894179_10430 [Bacteroidia bacterium]|nr:hypothetical protein FACS1894179_10430 [Bacteroidia bacterium]